MTKSLNKLAYRITTRSLVIFIIFNIVLLKPCFSENNISSNQGKDLFKSNCASCHQPGRELIGPDLNDINDRMPREWLIKFIKNSQEIIQSGDEYSVKLFIEYKKVIMPPADLSEEEIIIILDYLNKESKLKQSLQSAEQKDVILEKSVPEPKRLKRYYPYPTWSIIIFIIILILISGYITIKLKLRLSRTPSKFDHRIEKIYFFVTKRVSKLFHYLIFIIFSISIFIILFNLSRNIIFANEVRKFAQPIVYSHKIHYDTYDIDCQYCHWEASKYPKANFPTLYVCMKCHNYIEEGEEFDKKEIKKIKDLFDSNIEVIWNEAFEMREFVRFDHSLHTKSAGLKCIECHSDIENIEIQQLDFNMKWCIDCHKDQEIDKENKYYKKAFDTILYDTSFKISDIGGVDCSKCHY